ncbi:MAG: protein kinase [Deltaproteobacteria bacterium]|nr:protein kinase [Deltaproteobacteria bacterium]
MTAAGTTSGSHAAQSGSRLAPGFQLGEYRIVAPLWPLRIADAYKAEGPKGPATLFVVHAVMSSNATIRDQIVAGTRAAAALPEHKHLVHTIAAGLTGEILWIATEEIEGSLVRELLQKKRMGSNRAGNAGLGMRATGNLVTGVTAALTDVHHGALADESIVVNRSGRVRVIDLALGAGVIAAMRAGLLPAQATIAPEVVKSGVPSGAGDVYSIGTLLYECLVGTSLERGGPRPSEVVPGVNSQIDELVARACHRDPEKRFGRCDVLGEVVGEALNKGGAMMTTAVPTLASAPSLADVQQVSLAAEIGAAGASGQMAASGSGDRVLASALADSNEKWLISKGKLDYGPFSLADVIAQIEKGDIVAGNIIMDKDSGARVDVSTHPMLGPMVDQARQRIDMQRRAQAEVAVQSREKKRGALLYSVIGLGVVGVAIGVYFVVQAARGDDPTKKVAGVSTLDGASLNVKVTMPKAPPKRNTGTRPGGTRPGGNYAKGSEDLSLDMSDEDDGGSSTLDMGTVYNVYSHYGGQLGGCLQRTGAGQANIGIIIDGPSGRVTFVKVDGKQAGATWSCLNGVLRGMKFPTLKSGRTRAEFDIGI